jgi:HSP20 family protein
MIFKQKEVYMTNTIEKRQNGNGYDASFGTVVNNLFQNSLRRFFDDNFWEADRPVTMGNVPVNIRETEKHYELDVIAPGYRKEDFNINVEGNLLTISIDRKEERGEVEKLGWVRNEYVQRGFLRTFTLDDTVDMENINATYTDGILHLSLGKSEKAKKLSKSITVK